MCQSVGRTKLKLKVVPQSKFKNGTQEEINDISNCPVTKEFVRNEKSDGAPRKVETLPPAPDVDFTFEEEFRIYELLVRKENLLDGMFEISLQFPKFLQTWKDCILSQCYGNMVTQEYKNFLNKRQETIIFNFTSGGSIWRSLDMFDEFKNVDNNVKMETLGFSFEVMRICIR